MEDSVVRRWHIRPLRESEIIDSFTCGDPDLDDYILNVASSYQAELLSVNYVLSDEDDNVIAFFSLLNDRICLYDFDNSKDFNKFRSKRFVQSKRHKGYPAVKIGRFGVSQYFRGFGIGSMLLDFIKSYFLKNSKSGCRFLTVDAYNSSIDFYSKNGFISLSHNNDKRTSMMYCDLIDFKNLL